MKRKTLVIAVMTLVVSAMHHHTKISTPKPAEKHSSIQLPASQQETNEDFDFITGNTICWKESI
jgi:hypothetical protein